MAEVPAVRIDVSHVGLFRALAKSAGVSQEREEALFDLLQAKDVPELREYVADLREPGRTALMELPGLYGGVEVLDRAAAVLLDSEGVRTAIEEMRTLHAQLTDLPLSFDLADLRGYHYHSGVVFAAYGAGSPSALGLGGRYDQVGEAFGRGRPATGFSVDLRQLAAGLPPVAAVGAVLAPLAADEGLHERIAALRNGGEVVVMALPGHQGTWKEAGCDRQLVRRGDEWVVETLQGE